MANQKQLMEEPLISIIVPIYNSEDTISRCLDSLVGQTYKNVEIILVNDGSSDSSQVKCDNYAQTDSRIRVFHKENEGVSSARNLGVEMAGGEYVLFVDSDDSLSTKACEILMNYQLDFNCDCIVYGFHQLSGKVWAPDRNVSYFSFDDFKKDYLFWLNTELLSSSVNKLYKRDMINILFPYHMSFGEDLIFSLSYLSHCEKISFIPDHLYIHDNLNVKSLSHSFNIDRFRDVEVIQEAITKFADVKEGKELYAKYVGDCVHIVRECLKTGSMSYLEKKLYLYKWLSSSRMLSLRLKNYSMDWRNRLMMFFLKYRMFFLSFIIVNGKHIMMKFVR